MRETTRRATQGRCSRGRPVTAFKGSKSCLDAGADFGEYVYGVTWPSRASAGHRRSGYEHGAWAPVADGNSASTSTGDEANKLVASLQEVVVALLAEGVLEGDDADDDAGGEEADGEEEPKEAPELRAAAGQAGEGGGVGLVDLPEDEVVADVPEGVEAGHDADEEDEELECGAVCDEPEADDEARHADEEDPHEPVAAGPPQREDEEEGQHKGHDLACADVERARDHGRAEETGTEIPGRQRHPGDAAAHAGGPALIGLEGDGLDLGAREEAHEGVAELVEADGEELEGVDDESEDGDVPGGI